MMEILLHSVYAMLFKDFFIYQSRTFLCLFEVKFAFAKYVFHTSLILICNNGYSLKKINPAVTKYCSYDVIYIHMSTSALMVDWVIY